MIKASEALQITNANPAFEALLKNVEMDIHIAAKQGKVQTTVFLGEGHSMDRLKNTLIENGYTVQQTVSGLQISWSRA